MKKTFTKFVAGIAAAAALILAAGCKNQLDYVNDTTALNKFNVAGFKVTGLDAAYNGAAVKLMVNEPAKDTDGNFTDNFVEYAAGKVADSYTNASGTVVGYQSGTAYVKLDTPVLFDGDKLNYATFDCYLQVGSETVKMLSSAGIVSNAKLAIPSSAAGTSDSALKTKYVDVVVTDGVGTFTLANSETEPVNVTLCKISLDILDCTADTLPAGVTVKTTAKTGTHQKYTVKMTGLTSNAGTSVVLGGADISLTDTGLGNCWYDSTGAFKQTISDKGEVSWTFYGSAVNGGDIAGWGRVYTSAVAGPEIVINQADETKKENGNRLLQSSVSRNGKVNDSMNFMFPGYTVGDYDVDVTIDVSQVAAASKSQADPVSPVSKITIDGIKVLSAPKVITGGTAVYVTDGDDDAERILFVPDNHWGTTCHSYTDADINSKGNYAWRFDTPATITPNATTFKIGARLTTPTTSGGFWVTQYGKYSAHYTTSEFAGGSYTLIIDCSDTSNVYEYLMPTSNVDYEFEVKVNKVIIDTALSNVELIGNFNKWSDSGTIAGTVVGTTTEFDVSGITLTDGFKVRTVGSWGPVNLGMADGNDISLPAAKKSGTFTIKLTYSANGFTAVAYE